MNAATEKQIEQVITLVAPGVGAIVAAVATPVVGAAVTGMLIAAAKLLALGLDPQAELEAIVARSTALDPAKAKVGAAEDAKFGPIAAEYLAQHDDIYADLEAK